MALSNHESELIIRRIAILDKDQLEAEIKKSSEIAEKAATDFENASDAADAAEKSRLEDVMLKREEENRIKKAFLQWREDLLLHEDKSFKDYQSKGDRAKITIIDPKTDTARNRYFRSIQEISFDIPQDIVQKHIDFIRANGELVQDFKNVHHEFKLKSEPLDTLKKELSKKKVMRVLGNIALFLAAVAVVVLIVGFWSMSFGGGAIVTGAIIGGVATASAGIFAGLGKYFRSKEGRPVFGELEQDKIEESSRRAISMEDSLKDVKRALQDVSNRIQKGFRDTKTRAED